MATLTYRYAAPSRLAAGEAPFLALATEESPFFFQGQLRRPERAAAALCCLAKVVASRFHDPAALAKARAQMLDPVVTYGADTLRLEGFSACCGIYARVDLPPAGYQPVRQAKGTTNVDFNQAMTDQLAKVKTGDSVSLAAGPEVFTLIHGEASVVEKKVPLPPRWLKGFTNAAGILATSSPHSSLSKLQVIELLRSTPATTAHRDSFSLDISRGRAQLVPGTRGGALEIGGAQRLRLLHDIARYAKSMEVYQDPVTAATVWVADLETLRFTLALSPDVSRGFSGEGTALEALTRETDYALVNAALELAEREDVIDPSALAARSDAKPAAIETTLAHLASQGLLGYDKAGERYFHRVLPFDMGLIERTNPRLAAARKLLREDGILSAERTNDSVTAEVRGTKEDHSVVIDFSGDGSRCTCPWFVKHASSRGPCKHQLAVRLAFAQPNP